MVKLRSTIGCRLGGGWAPAATAACSDVTPIAASRKAPRCFLVARPTLHEESRGAPGLREDPRCHRASARRAQPKSSRACASRRRNEPGRVAAKVLAVALVDGLDEQARARCRTRRRRPRRDRARSLRQPDTAQGHQLLDVDGFRDVVVGAGLQTVVAVVAHRLRGQRDDRQAGERRAGADRVRPSISGIMMSMSTRSGGGSLPIASSASRPLRASCRVAPRRQRLERHGHPGCPWQRV